MESDLQTKPQDVVSEKDGEDVVPKMGGEPGSSKDMAQEVPEKEVGVGRRGLRPLRHRDRSRSRSRSESRDGRLLQSGGELSDGAEAMSSGSESMRSLRVSIERLPKTYGKASKRPLSDPSPVESPKQKMAASQKGRGRPLTAGEYVGLHKAKLALLELEKEELRVQAEKEMAETLRDYTTRSRSLSIASSMGEATDEETAVVLCQQVQESVEVILKVAKNSGNLKGTFVRGLKDAASSIIGAMRKLSTRTASDENARLEAHTMRMEAENTKLKAELASFQKQLDEIRLEQANFRRLSEQSNRDHGHDIGLPDERSPRPRETNQQGRTLTDADMREIMVQVGTMFNAKWEAVEQRLPPAPRIRPPLAADRVSEAPESSAQDWPTLRPKAPASSEISKSGPSKDSENKGPEKGKRRRRKGSAKNSKKNEKASEKRKEVANSTPSNQIPDAPQPAEGEWVKVVKKGKKANPKAAHKAAKPAKHEKGPKVRVPRSTAVVITLQPEGEKKGLTYSKILTSAKSKIDLPTLGISGGIKIRSAVTGARILEIPGASSAAHADSLAESLKQAFGEDEVKVSRPTKCAELRIVDLDETVTPEDVVAAISKETGCPADAIKTGDVRRSKSGLGTLWLRCPAADAKKMAAKGKILVGWVSARIKMLELRPLRCYRCHDGGHVKCKCTSAIDRSDLCYRCGLAGHKAALCSAAPSCSLCSAAGKPAGHIVGSKACTLPPGKKTMPKSIRAQPVEAMDEEVEVEVPGPTSSRGKKGGAA